MKMITAAALVAVATLSLAACDTETESESQATEKTQETTPEETGETRPPLPPLCEGEEAAFAPCAFAETLRDQVIEDNGGLLDHGVEPALILASFPGIIPADLNDMPVSQGKMVLVDGTLAFKSNGTPLTSGATTLTAKSYLVIFRNVSKRRGLRPVTGEQGYEFAQELRQPL